MFKLSDVKAKATGFLNNYREKDPATYAAAQQAIGGVLILDGFVGIDNPLGGKKRPGIFGSLIGVVLGLIFVGVGFFGAALFGLNKYTAQTNATVISVGSPSAATRNADGSTSGGGACSMTVHYTVNGQDYTTTSSLSSSSNCGQTVGSTVSISYNPDKPGSWATDVNTTKNIIKIFGYAGILVVLGSLFTFTLRLLSIIFGWKLLKSGRALAKTLPGGVDLSSVISSIRTQFAQLLHGGNAVSPAANPIAEVLSQTVAGAPAPSATLASPQPTIAPQPAVPAVTPQAPPAVSTEPKPTDQNPTTPSV